MTPSCSDPIEPWVFGQMKTGLDFEKNGGNKRKTGFDNNNQ